MIARLVVGALLVLLLGPAGAAPKSGSVVRVEHRDPTTAPTRGPTSALVTVELFYIPTTSSASRLPALRALEKLQANHPTRIRLVYRVLKRGAAQQISIAALEAHAQGKFVEFMDELHNDKTMQMLTKEKVLETAKRVGVDVARLANAISEDRYKDVFEANDHRLARLAHTESAPAPNVLFNSRIPRASLGTPNDADFEREYVTAYERALELIDRGVPVDKLAQAFDDQALRTTQPFVGGGEDEEGSGDHKLAKPPLDLTNLPTFGLDKAAAIPIVVLCRPNDVSCYNLMRSVQKYQRMFSSEVRIVWAPWFDVSHDSAAELAMLGDAALCAEQLGSTDDLESSPGWAWVNKQLEAMQRSHGRRIPAERLIDSVTSELEIDSQQLSACRARIANTTLDWIARARRSGVTRSPALVIGGRIYEALANDTIIQQLIEAELAPGVLGRCATIGCASD